MQKRLTHNQVKKIGIVWHIHQPDFVPDDEVLRQIEESYQKILDAHLVTKIPLTLNITGALLARISYLSPHLLQSIKNLLDLGLLELLGSGYYHPMLPILSTEDALAQVKLDFAKKQKIFGIKPVGFWPTDLGWSPTMVPLLAKFGFNWCIVDSFGLHGSNILPKWKHRAVNGHQVLEPDLAEISFAEEQHRPYQMELAGESIAIIVRDRELSLELSDFESGILYNHSSIDGYIEKILSISSNNDYILIGEDGERVNLQTYRNYLLFLQRLVEKQQQIQVITPTKFLSGKSKLEKRYFPANTFQNDLYPWQQTMDDQVFLNTLNRVSFLATWISNKLKNAKNVHKSRKLAKAQSLIYQAEDSGHIFWKFHNRTRQPGWELLLEAEKILTSI